MPVRPLPPNEPGWYWYKFGKKPWAIAKVFLVKGTNRLEAWIGFDEPNYWLGEQRNGWIEYVTAWSGPIQPPEGMT